MSPFQYYFQKCHLLYHCDSFRVNSLQEVERRNFIVIVALVTFTLERSWKRVFWGSNKRVIHFKLKDTPFLFIHNFSHTCKKVRVVPGFARVYGTSSAYPALVLFWKMSFCRPTRKQLPVLLSASKPRIEGYGTSYETESQLCRERFVLRRFPLPQGLRLKRWIESRGVPKCSSLLPVRFSCLFWTPCLDSLPKLFLVKLGPKLLEYQPGIL